MLVNEASINAVALYFCNTISRQQICLHHSVTVSDRQRSGQPRVTTPAEYCYIHPQQPKKSFCNAALESINTPSKRCITAQTVRNRLC